MKAGGRGKIYPTVFCTETIDNTHICHGCGGLGWVTVPD
jgi:hypothetical protein